MTIDAAVAVTDEGVSIMYISKDSIICRIDYRFSVKSRYFSSVLDAFLPVDGAGDSRGVR